MWHRVVVGALVLLLVGIGGAGAASLRATFETFLDRLAWLLRSGPGDTTRAELRSWEPAPGGARATSDLVVDLFGLALPVPLVHAVRETMTGVRVTTRLDVDRLTPESRATVEALLPAYRDLILDVTLDDRGRWEGELRLPPFTVDDPDVTGEIGASRVAFTLDFGPGERFAGAVRIHFGRMWGRDDEARFDLELQPVDVRFETLRYHLGRPLLGYGEVGGAGARLSVREAEGDSEMVVGPFRVSGSSRALEDGRTHLAFDLDFAFTRILVPDEAPVGPGRIRFDFALEGMSVAFLRRLIESSAAMDPLALALGPEDSAELGREMARELFGRPGRLTVAGSFALEGRRAVVDLDVGWPAPVRDLRTLADWLELLEGRLRLDIPLDLAEDPQLQQSLAAPVAMGLATVRDGRVQADLRITGGMILGGPQPQPLAALLGDVAAVPLDVPAR